MAKVAITGAGGFTGRYLSRLLVEQGHEVHGLVRDGKDGEQLAIPNQICDLTDAASVAHALTALRPDKIVHLAAISFVAHGNADDIYRSNIVGTRNLLQAALDLASPIDSILLASSANIYGNQTHGALTEDTVPAPVNDYAVSKLAMEHVARIYASQLPIIVTRPFNYTGVGQRANFLIPKIIDHFRRRADHIELGNLDVARDFSDVRAVVAAYSGLLSQPEAIGGTYNICSGRAYALKEIIDMAQVISGHTIEVVVNPAFVRENEVKMLKGDRSRLDRILPALANPPLDETIRWMIEA